MTSTTGELVKAKTIVLEDVQRALDAQRANPDHGEFDFRGGYVLVLTVTVASRLYAKPIWADTSQSFCGAWRPTLGPSVRALTAACARGRCFFRIDG